MLVGRAPPTSAHPADRAQLGEVHGLGTPHRKRITKQCVRCERGRRTLSLARVPLRYPAVQCIRLEGMAPVLDGRQHARFRQPAHKEAAEQPPPTRCQRRVFLCEPRRRTS